MNTLLLALTTVACVASKNVELLERPNDDIDDAVPSCAPYGYCEGTVFPSIVRVDDRDIICDVEQNPKAECCLPHAKHMVCYSMVMNGQYFNIDSSHSATTDFSELCKAMLLAVGKVPGRHSTVIVAKGGGTVNYRNEKLQYLDQSESGVKHIHHLACAYAD